LEFNLHNMATLTNSTQHQQLTEMTSSSPADSVLSAITSLLGSVSGWELIVTTLLAIVIYDQGKCLQGAQADEKSQVSNE